MLMRQMSTSTAPKMKQNIIDNITNVIVKRRSKFPPNELSYEAPFNDKKTRIFAFCSAFIFK